MRMSSFIHARHEAHYWIRFAGPVFPYRQRWTPVLCRPGADDPFPEHGSHQRYSAWVFDRTPGQRSLGGVLKVFDFPQYIFDEVLDREKKHGRMSFSSKGPVWILRWPTVSGHPTVALTELEEESPFTEAEMLTLRRMGKKIETRRLRMLRRMQEVRGPHSAQEVRERTEKHEAFLASLEVAASI